MSAYSGSRTGCSVEHKTMETVKRSGAALDLGGTNEWNAEDL